MEAILQNETIGKFSTLYGSRIAGVVTCCPAQKIENLSFLDRFTIQDIESVKKLTGVSSRYWVNESQSGLDLSISAATKLLHGLNWDSKNIDAIVYVSQSPENILPATSIRMGSSIGARPGIAAFDINLGCSGYPYGLYILMSMVQTGLIRKGLLVASETPSRIVDPYDKSTAMLFGDAGSVTAIESAEINYKSHFIMGSDGAGADNLVIPNCRFSAKKNKVDKRLAGHNPDFLFMDGPEIFNFTIKTVPPLVNEAIKNAKTPLDVFLFHQANTFMLEHLRKKMKLSKDLVPLNIADFGNTSVASIPLLLTTKVRSLRNTKTKLHLGMFGFGVGYSWASCTTNIDCQVYLEHIHV
jgi:3-oxoacyl-[acyl-carrier-protein] synthase-3